MIDSYLLFEAIFRNDALIFQLDHVIAANLANQRLDAQRAQHGACSVQLNRFWPRRPPNEVSRRQDAPMRSIDVFWFQLL